jgi:hypothetical protein
LNLPILEEMSVSGLLGVGSGYGLSGWMQAFDASASTVSAASGVAANEKADAASGGPDLVDGMVGMDLAADGFKASLAAFRTADDMLGTLLDMQA